MGLFSLMLTMTSFTPAYATVTTSIKNPPYDHGGTDWYSTTGGHYCNPAEDTPDYHARECAFFTTSNGITQVDAEAGLWRTDPLYRVETADLAYFGIAGDAPTTTCLSNGYFKFRDQHGYDGYTYMSDNTNADGFLTHMFRIYKSPSCNGVWNSAYYDSFSGQILRAGSPGTVTHFSGTPLVYTGVYPGATGMFSVRLESSASGLAENVDNAYGFANFYDYGSQSGLGSQVISIKSFSCTGLTECINAI